MPVPLCPATRWSLSLKTILKTGSRTRTANFLARCVFPEKVQEFSVEVDLTAEMTVINPFDFFVEPSADEWPFAYDAWLAKDLRPYLECEQPGPSLAAWLASVDCVKQNTVDFAVSLNQRLQQEIGYLIRLEPGVQAPEVTLNSRSGSCRDSAWLLVQILRNLGIAARFASGYLVQLVPDVKSLDGPFRRRARLHRSACLDRGLHSRGRLDRS